MIRLLTAALLFASFHAVAEVSLTDINNNEVADAEVVMGNFNALKEGVEENKAGLDALRQDFSSKIPLPVWVDADGDVLGYQAIYSGRSDLIFLKFSGDNRLFLSPFRMISSPKYYQQEPLYFATNDCSGDSYSYPEASGRPFDYPTLAIGMDEMLFKPVAKVVVDSAPDKLLSYARWQNNEMVCLTTDRGSWVVDPDRGDAYEYAPIGIAADHGATFPLRLEYRQVG